MAGDNLGVPKRNVVWLGNQGWGGLRGLVLWRERVSYLSFGGTGPHTFHGEDCTVEADLRPSDSALGTVEDDSMLAGCLH